MIQPISDVVVQIDVLHPQPRVGLGVPAIFVKGTEASHKEYNDLETLEQDFPAAYLKARSIWLQNNRPNKIAVVTYVEGDVAKAAEQYFFEGWHFALLAEYNAVDALALSNLIEEQNFKFLVIQVDTADELTPFSGNNLTISLVHPTMEYLDAALLGNTSSLTVGSVTWKGRNNLVGIKANPLTISELNTIHKAGGLAYVSKAGIPQLSEGKTVGGEFIDALHGDHWVKATIESRLQTLLSSTDKITFDANGIALLQNELMTVMEEAFTNGIIDLNDETGTGNYSITALQRADLDPDDIARRNYRGLSFTYKRSGAVHSVNVYGTIEV